MPVKLPSDNEPISEINITPFVDIVLVLLVIFMMTAQFISWQGINLELPSAKSSESLKKNRNVTIAISKDSTYFVDGKTMSLNEIIDFFKKNFKNKDSVSVTISADKSVPYQSLVQLMDLLRLQGISRFALQMNSNS